jgi:hypothetical protein
VAQKASALPKNFRTSCKIFSTRETHYFLNAFIVAFDPSRIAKIIFKFMFTYKFSTQKPTYFPRFLLHRILSKEKQKAPTFSLTTKPKNRNRRTA